MAPLASIAVGIDFTQGCNAAMAQALRLSQPQTGRITAIHVVERSVLDDAAAALHLAARDYGEAARMRAQLALEKFIQDNAKDANVRPVVGIGSVAAEVVRAARDAEADLLILGAHGAGNSHGSIGAVAGRCIRLSRVPVLMVRGGQTGPFRRVVACVDFSDTSLRALDRAVDLALHDGAALDVVHVYRLPDPEPPFPMPPLGGVPLPAPDLSELVSRLREYAERRLADLLWSIKERTRDLEIRPVAIEGFGYGPAIVSYIASIRADLVVLGTQGRANLRYALLGSTAERILRDARCSVLAVRPDQAADESDELAAQAIEDKPATQAQLRA